MKQLVIKNDACRKWFIFSYKNAYKPERKRRYKIKHEKRRAYRSNRIIFRRCFKFSLFPLCLVPSQLVTWRSHVICKRSVAMSQQQKLFSVYLITFALVVGFFSFVLRSSTCFVSIFFPCVTFQTIVHHLAHWMTSFFFLSNLITCPTKQAKSKSSRISRLESVEFIKNITDITASILDVCSVHWPTFSAWKWMTKYIKSERFIYGQSIKKIFERKDNSKWCVHAAHITQKKACPSMRFIKRHSTYLQAAHKNTFFSLCVLSTVNNSSFGKTVLSSSSLFDGSSQAAAIFDSKSKFEMCLFTGLHRDIEIWEFEVFRG